MPRTTLTGSRIRDRRMGLGMRQAELARRAGISASYLNLIEHNRRRIGGKVLLAIAEALEVEPAALSEGAEAALLATLRQAAADQVPATAELDRLEEFTGRFPGWADMIASQHQRIGALEEAVTALTDRLAHDPHLAASMHEVLSTVTAIHASAEILVDDPGIPPEWRARFHRNIAEDSARLAEGARRLVSELEEGASKETVLAAPQDEVESFFSARGYYFPELENAPEASTVSDLVDGAGSGLVSAAAKLLARRALEVYAQDARILPAATLAEALPEEESPDPSQLAARFGLDPGRMMRRLAALPADLLASRGQRPFGLVACDASGALTFRKPLSAFPLPRFGAACPLWPLFQSLSRPMMPLRQVIRLAGRTDGVFVTHAIAQPAGPQVPNRDPMFEAHMLIQPMPSATALKEMPRVGVTCRICPKPACRGRREPAIMAEDA